MTVNTNELVIYALVFLLGLLIGVFLTAGGRRKWKERYNTEIDRRRELEKAHEARIKEMDARERDLRDRDNLRAAAVRDRDPDERP